MCTKITSLEQINSLTGDDVLVDMSQKEKPIKYNIGFICNLYIKVVSGISKATIRKIFPPRVLISDEWYIE
jgi:hypothetical protein